MEASLQSLFKVSELACLLLEVFEHDSITPPPLETAWNGKKGNGEYERILFPMYTDTGINGTTKEVSAVKTQPGTVTTYK
jgi:hypothetical protein